MLTLRRVLFCQPIRRSSFSLNVVAMASSSGPPAAKKAKVAAPSASAHTSQKNASSSDPDSIHSILKRLRQETTTSSSDAVSVNASRVQKLQGDEGILAREAKAVVYWMSREQRVQDNWSLLYAQQLATEHRLPLHVVFCLQPGFLGATLRHYDFMLTGLEEVERELRKLRIPFHLLEGKPEQKLPEFLESKGAKAVVADFSPLRVARQWLRDLQSKLSKSSTCLYLVDAHNVVPAWVASDKCEHMARTIRPKIHKKLDVYLKEFPAVVKHKFREEKDADKEEEGVDWEIVRKGLTVDRSVGPVTTKNALVSGTRHGLDTLSDFCRNKLRIYADKSNDPNADALSNMSPYLHFGQVSAQRAVLYVQRFKAKHAKSVEAFVEQTLVRKELAENFCYYKEDTYSSLKGSLDWARTSLDLHRKDKRDHVYNLRQWEEAKTHDPLWNACQLQMVNEGKMHGYMRMYWAKKLLEWSASPEVALETAIYLNDRYQLDGRDPNGYVGCLWSIGGIHDQGWRERSVFGKIRYMNYDGCKRKFDITSYMRRHGGKSHK